MTDDHIWIREIPVCKVCNASLEIDNQGDLDCPNDTSHVWNVGGADYTSRIAVDVRELVKAFREQDAIDVIKMLESIERSAGA